MLSAQYRSLQTRMVHKAEAKAPKRKQCPKCKKLRLISKFGFRTMHNKRGKPLRTMPQSYCQYCRKGTVH